MFPRARYYFYRFIIALISLFVLFLLSFFLLLASLQYCPTCWKSILLGVIHEKLGQDLSFSGDYQPHLFSLHPSIQVNRLLFGRPQEALSIEQLRLSFRWRDVLFWYPHAQAITITHAVVPIVHVQGQEYRIAAIPVSFAGPSSRTPWSWFLMQARVTLNDLSIHYTDQQQSHWLPLVTTIDTFFWQHEHKPYSMSVHGAFSQHYAGSFDVSVLFDDLSLVDPLSSHLFFRGHLDPIMLAPVFQVISAYGLAPSDLSVQAGTLSLSWNSEWYNRHVMLLKADIGLDALHVTYRDQPFFFDSIALHPHLTTPLEDSLLSEQPPKQWDVDFDPFIYSYRGKVQRIQSLHLMAQNQAYRSPHVTVTLPFLSLPDMMPLFSDVLIATQKEDVFKGWGVEGMLSNLVLSDDLSDFSSLHHLFVQAHIEDFGIHDQHKNQLLHFFGDVKLDQQHLSLSAEAPSLYLSAPEWLEEPIQGQLSARCSASLFDLWSCSSLHLKTPHESFKGTVELHFPAGKDVPVIHAHLVSPSLPAERFHLYFPRSLAEVHAYLKRAFLAGTFSHIDLLWKGALDRFPYRGQTQEHFAIRADYHDIRLQYADDWLPVEHLSGHVLYDGQQVLLTNMRAHYHDLSFQNGRLLFPDLNMSALQLFIQVAGPAEQYFDFMRETPLRSYVNAWSHFSMSGPVTLQAKLNLPWENPDQLKLALMIHLDHSILYWQKKILCQLGGDLFIDQDFLRFPSSLTGECDAHPWHLMTHKKDKGEETEVEGILRPRFLSELLNYPGLAKSMQGTLPVHLLFNRGQNHFSVQAEAHLTDLRFAKPLDRLFVSSPKMAYLDYVHSSNEQSFAFSVDKSLSFSLDNHAEQANHIAVFCQLNRLDPLAFYHWFTDWQTVSPSTQASRSGSLLATALLPWLKKTDWQVACGADHLLLAGADQGPLNLSSQHRAMNPVLKLRTQGWATGQYIWDVDRNALAADMAYMRWKVPAAVGKLLAPAEFVRLMPSGESGLKNLCPLDLELTHPLQLFPCRIDAAGDILPASTKEDTLDQALFDYVFPTLPPLTAPVAPAEDDELSLMIKAIEKHSRQLSAWLSYFSLLNIDIHAISVGQRDWGMMSLRGEKRHQHFVLTKLLTNSPLFNLFFLEDPFQKSDTDHHYLFSLDVDDLGSLVYPSGSDDPAIVGGQLQLKGSISWPCEDVLPSLRTLSASLDLDVKKGNLPRIRPGFAKILGLLNIGYVARYLTGQETGSLRDQAFFFDDLSADLNVAHGQSQLTDLSLKSPLVSLKGNGVFVFFPASFDGQIIVIPDAASSSLLVGALLGLSPLSLILLNANSFVLNRFSSVFGIRYSIQYDKGEWLVTRG